MDYEIITAYAVHGDGGQNMKGPLIVVCSTEAKAKQVCKGRGWYGGDGSIVPRKLLRVGDVHFLLEREFSIDMDGELAKKKENYRKKLLDNMSEYDKEILGL